MKSLADFCYGVHEEFLVSLIQFPLIFVSETLVDGAVCHVDIIDIGIFPFIIHDAKNVDVIDGVAHHLTLGTEVFHQDVLFLDKFRLLKSHLVRQPKHLVIQMLDYLARVSLQNLPRLSHVGLVIVVRLLTDAWRVTVVNVVF